MCDCNRYYIIFTAIYIVYILFFILNSRATTTKSIPFGNILEINGEEGTDMYSNCNNYNGVPPLSKRWPEDMFRILHSLGERESEITSTCRARVSTQFRILPNFHECQSRQSVWHTWSADSKKHDDRTWKRNYANEN